MNYNIRPRFKIPSRELKVEHQVGYEVDIQQISGNGLLFVYFDSDTDKAALHRLRNAMSFFYEDKVTQTSYRKKLENLIIGEICMARIERARNLILEHRLKGAEMYEHHRVRIQEINDSDKDDVWVLIKFLDSIRPDINHPLEHIYHINPQFLLDPAHVMTCQLAGVEELEGTNVVEKVMKKRPPPERLMVDMFVLTLPTKKGELPVVTVRRKMDSKMFEMKEYVIGNFGALGPLATLQSNDVNYCRIGDADTQGHVWVCPIYHLKWAFELMVTLSKKLYSKPERKNLVAAGSWSAVRMYGEVAKSEKSEGYKELFLAVRDPTVNHFGDVEFTQFDRARILDVDLDTDQITVRHIDTGEKAVYLPEDLYQIPEDNRVLKCFPPLTVKVRLQYIRTLVEDGVDYLMKTVRDTNVTVQVPIEQNRLSEHVYDARIFINPDTKAEENLSKHLISTIKCGTAFKYKPELKKWTPMI